MNVSLKSNTDLLTARLGGEIDHHSAAVIRAQIDSVIQKQRPRLLELDFGAVTFMDSSGIGLVLGRYKLMSETGGRVRVTNLSKKAHRIMLMAGLQKLAELSVKEEEK